MKSRIRLKLAGVKNYSSHCSVPRRSIAVNFSNYPKKRMAAQLTISAKKQLRKEVTARLRTLPPALVLEESRLVVQHVLASTAWKSARNISVYLSTPVGEIQTDDLVRAAFIQGKQLLLHFVEFVYLFCWLFRQSFIHSFLSFEGADSDENATTSVCGSL